MTTIDRRRFLQTGALGLGAGLVEPGAAAAYGGGAVQEGLVPAPGSRRVRMSGDGLGLTAADQASVLTRLAEEGRIAPDSYSNGGTVAELERQLAALLGKERAVFMPTGTLANHLAVRALAGGTGRAIVQAESHLFNDSGDCVQTLSNITLMPLAPGTGTFTLDQVQEVIDRTASGRVARPVSVISVETPVRRRYGEMFDQTELDRVTAFARREGIRLHLDGARLFLQSAYTGVDVAEYARPFDTVYVSLYKYFNAVSGAILAGPRALLDEMYHTRRMFGAGLPGAWPFAAVALHYLPGFVDRFRDAVEVSESFIQQVARHDAFAVERMPLPTNLLRLRVTGTDATAFRRRLREHDVELGAPRLDGFALVGINETWNRRSASDLAETFIAAL